jgi:phosphoribosylformylglycinamidine synthase subunit PurS
MNYSAEIKVMPLKELLDPQGKAVLDGLSNLSIKSINDVRIGKHIQLQIKAISKEEALGIAEESAKKLLANPVMEEYSIQISEG